MQFSKLSKLHFNFHFNLHLNWCYTVRTIKNKEETSEVAKIYRGGIEIKNRNFTFEVEGQPPSSAEIFAVDAFDPGTMILDVIDKNGRGFSAPLKKIVEAVDKVFPEPESDCLCS